MTYMPTCVYHTVSMLQALEILLSRYVDMVLSNDNSNMTLRYYVTVEPDMTTA